jgi:hypothetical protein
MNREFQKSRLSYDAAQIPLQPKQVRRQAATRLLANIKMLLAANDPKYIKGNRNAG